MASRRMARMPDPKPRRWFRYSLRTLFIVMTVVCLVSGFWLNKTFRKRDAVRRFHQLTAERTGGLVTMLYRHEGNIHSVAIVPEWLHPVRDMIGAEAFGSPIGVQLQNTETTDADLRYLRDVPTVREVWANQTKVSDEGLRHLRACPNLQFLNLDNTTITDMGLAEISRLTELNSLSLSGTKITDDGLVHLAKLPKLKDMWLRNTAITDAGYRKLQAALPECEIQADVAAYREKHRVQHWGGYLKH